MKRFLDRLASDERGATAIEYGLIAALIAVVLITALNTLSGKISGTFGLISEKMPQAAAN